jgi:hypothetical protein
MEIKAEFYQWGVNDIPPDWVVNALADRTIVVDGDDDAFLVSDAGGRMRIDPGDFLMQTMTTIFIVEERLYYAMRDAAKVERMKKLLNVTTPVDPAVDDRAENRGLGPPPYSSAVLARSAWARMRQSVYDQERRKTPTHPVDGSGIPPDMHEFVDANGPENAEIEGADVPSPMPDLVSPDPPKST